MSLLAVTPRVHLNCGSEEVVMSAASHVRWHLDVFERLQRDSSPTVQGWVSILVSEQICATHSQLSQRGIFLFLLWVCSGLKIINLFIRWLIVFVTGFSDCSQDARMHRQCSQPEGIYLICLLSTAMLSTVKLHHHYIWLQGGQRGKGGLSECIRTRLSNRNRSHFF